MSQDTNVFIKAITMAHLRTVLGNVKEFVLKYT